MEGGGGEREREWERGIFCILLNGVFHLKMYICIYIYIYIYIHVYFFFCFYLGSGALFLYRHAWWFVIDLVKPKSMVQVYARLNDGV